MAQKPLALIFDFDGTIADTFHHLIEIGNRLSEEYKYKKIRPQDIGLLKDKNVQEVVQHLGIPLLKVPLIVARCKLEMHDKIEHIKPIDGLKETLTELKERGVKLGILTSNSLKNVSSFLKNNQLELFDFIRSTPKIWSKNKSLLKLLKEHDLKTGEVIYVGDETRDIIAAKKAGVPAAAVTWGYNSHKALYDEHPDHLVDLPVE